MTMTNAEWMISQGMKFSDLTSKLLDDVKGIIFYSYRTMEIYCGSDNLVGKTRYVTGDGVLKTLLRWLDEEHVDILLKNKEREYLSKVIEPFKDQIISIYKEQFGFNHESIIIEYYDFDRSQSTLCLPQFEKSSMYAGMECDRKYTLEELGL